MESPQSDLIRRIQGASESELDRLLQEQLAGLGGAEVRQLFRNPFLSRSMIERLLSAPHLLRSYEFRLEAARHLRTPQLVAIRFLAGLFWPDLVRIGLDTRLHPLVRRAAEQRLTERLPGLAVGERMALARTASRGLIGALRNDPTPRVIEAMLENPRMTEGLLVPLVSSETALPAILGVVARSPKWSVRYPVRLALCRNPRTPVERVLHHLPLLKKSDLQGIAHDARLTLPVRRRAELLARGRERESPS